MSHRKRWVTGGMTAAGKEPDSFGLDEEDMTR